jgi:hypothetical protein
MTTADWAAWVQAIGSIAAIGAGFATVYVQNRTADKLRERDRTERAEVVAFRLSGWLGEMGARIQLTSERFEDLAKHPPMRQPYEIEIAARLKLDVRVGIESVMSDLHYLKNGSGDVAQLDYFTIDFNDILDQAEKSSVEKPYSEAKLEQFYSLIGDKLRNIQKLCAEAVRHLTPVIDAAVEKGRAIRIPTASGVITPREALSPSSLLDKCRPPISGPCRQLTSPPTSSPR